MFAKVLVANRGEIAVRAFRAAYELGAQTVAVFPYEDRNAVHRIKADEAYEIGERGHPVRAYLDIDEIIRAAQAVRRRRDLPRLRLPEREPRPGPGLRGGRHHLHRPAGRRARAGRQQGPGARGRPGRRHPDAQVHPALGRPGRAGRRRRGDRLPGLRQGGGRRRRPRHAPGGRAGGAARRRGGGDAGGRGRVRRSDGVHRAGGRPAAAHRGADPGRHPGHHAAPVRAGLLDPAPAPEGGRDRPGAAHHRRAAGRAVRRRGDVRRVDQLLLRRHGGVPGRDRGRAGRPARLHRDEPADPGRAHRHRGDHRRRPGAGPDADRVRREPGRPRPEPGQPPDQRRRPAVPDHHRGPGQRLPARHRHDHRLPLGGRRRRTPGRRHGRRRRGDQCPLRLDAGQADLPRPHVRGGGGPGEAVAGRVPDPRREHQHPVPAGRAGGPGLRRRGHLHRLHRAAAGAADHPRARPTAAPSCCAGWPR